jgi:hypothetical protein
MRATPMARGYTLRGRRLWAVKLNECARIWTEPLLYLSEWCLEQTIRSDRKVVTRPDVRELGGRVRKRSDEQATHKSSVDHPERGPQPVAIWLLEAARFRALRCTDPIDSAGAVTPNVQLATLVLSESADIERGGC